MLHEIICDQFKQKRIEFNPNLNTILGDDIGSNSIGKSTFLMIIDFVFGGKDYLLKATDIQRNVGNHQIKYCFIFKNTKYFFLRNTDDSEIVHICNDNYNITSDMPLKDYCYFLYKCYEIDLYDISFRDIVGRYSRIYGKSNLNEKRPLDIVPNEKAGAPINSLLKLFNMYKVISDLEDLLKRKEAEHSAFKNAQKFDFIAKINKKKYKENLKQVEILKNEKYILTKKLEENLIDIDSLKAEELIKLKQKLATLRRHKNKLHTQLIAIESNINDTKTIKSEQFQDLLQYFPNANTKRLDEIDRFHKEIRATLVSEFKAKKDELSPLIDISQDEINSIENKIRETISVPSIPKTMLQNYSNFQKQIETIENENNAYEKEGTLLTAKTDSANRRDKMKEEQLLSLQNIINIKMQELNDDIYSSKKKPPVLAFNQNNYTFETIDDTGTGTSYKSMIVYDLSVLELSALPILIHDSVMLKQISDEALEKILSLYISTGKQIFIAFDKKTSYSEKSKKTLIGTKVLELAPNGDELFGRAWNNKYL